MENSTERNPQSISWWITSLAISIACCAVLFVIFAGYLSDIKKQLSAENEQLMQVSAHQDRLLVEIQAMQHSITPSQPPAPAMVVVPAAPAVAVEPPAMTPPTGTTAPTVTTPPAAAPTAIPEVPAKK